MHWVWDVFAKNGLGTFRLLAVKFYVETRLFTSFSLFIISGFGQFLVATLYTIYHYVVHCQNAMVHQYAK